MPNQKTGGYRIAGNRDNAVRNSDTNQVLGEYPSQPDWQNFER